MALTTVTIATTSIGLVAAVTPVTITLISNQSYVDNGVDDIQRLIVTQTASDGTLSIGLESNAGLSDTASTYTFTIGPQVAGALANVYSGVVVPGSGPVTLLSLLPAVTVRTVLITFTSFDGSDAPEIALGASARLSVDCTNLDGVLILSRTPILATTDSGGNGVFHLERTDQLTPVSGGGEPYWTFTIGGNTYLKKVHAAGNLLALPTALPGAINGSVSATQTGVNSTLTPLVDDADQAAATLADDIAVFKARIPGARRTITTSAAISATTDDNILCNSAGGNIALTLPLATARTRKYYFIKTASANTVTLTATGGNLINGAATLVLSNQYAGAVLESDGGTNWYANIGSVGGTLELTDGTTDLTGVTKITVARMVVGGTAGAATLGPPIGSTSVAGVVKADGTTIHVDGAGTLSSPGGGLPFSAEGSLVTSNASSAAVELKLGTPGQVPSPVGSDIGWIVPPDASGWVPPNTTPNSLVAFIPVNITSAVVGFIGDSTTANTPAGGTAPPTLTATNLTTSGVAVTANNQGVGGSTTTTWLPGTTNYNAATAAFAGAGVRVVSIMLGVNDSTTILRTSVATYFSNLQSIANALVQAGYIVVLHYPMYAVIGSSAGQIDATSLTLLQGYQGAINTIVNGFTIRQGDTSAYLFYAAHTSELSDGIHPTAGGSIDLATLWAAGLKRAVAGVTQRVAYQQVTLGSGLSLSGGVLSAAGAGRVYGPLTNGANPPVFILGAGNAVIMVPIS